MGFKLVLILLLTAAVVTQCVYTIVPTATQLAQEEKAEDRALEFGAGKGILVRSFRLRSRLNTHLLMLKFRK